MPMTIISLSKCKEREPIDWFCWIKSRYSDDDDGYVAPKIDKRNMPKSCDLPMKTIEKLLLFQEYFGSKWITERW